MKSIQYDGQIWYKFIIPIQRERDERVERLKRVDPQEADYALNIGEESQWSQ